jgi:ribosomal protein L37AE/L43A
MSQNNSLYNKEECPMCHFVFTHGFDQDKQRQCPSCKKKFLSGQQINHGPGCSICSNRQRGSNNVYHQDGCPAIMSDGRFITYYNSTNELTEAMRKLNGIKSSNEFRTFMQKNGNLFREADRNNAIREYTCSPTTACSEGWYNLWTNQGGDWANNNPTLNSNPFYQKPVASSQSVPTPR